MAQQVQLQQPVQTSMGEELYSGSAEFGRIMSFIGLIISSIIGISLIVVGISFIYSKDTYTIKTEAKVLEYNCIPQDTVYRCTLKVQYKIYGKTYTSVVPTTSNVDYKFIDNVMIYADPEDPTNIVIYKFNKKLIGSLMILFGILIPLFAWIWYYITLKSKFAASASGVVSVVDLLRR